MDFQKFNSLCNYFSNIYMLRCCYRLPRCWRWSWTYPQENWTVLHSNQLVRAISWRLIILHYNPVNDVKALPEHQRYTYSLTTHKHVHVHSNGDTIVNYVLISAEGERGTLRVYSGRLLINQSIHICCVHVHVESSSLNGIQELGKQVRCDLLY